MVGEILGILGRIAGTVAERVFPDPAQEMKRLELQQALQAAVLERTSDIEKAAAEVVKTEAQGQSWRATRQSWSGGREIADFLKSCLSSSGCESRPAKAEPGRPVASLAAES
jgi:hypothetical protein